MPSTSRDSDARPSSLSPREFASALGVSESSVKRWVDSGRIRAAKTAGGHRRIPLPEAVRYIRDQRLEVVRPEVLGLREIDPTRGAASDELVRARLEEALTEGRAAEVKGLLVSMVLAGRSIPSIIDGPLSEALRAIGALYLHEGAAGIRVEHRASEIAQQSLRELATLIPVDESGPVAIGAAVGGDVHLLPTLSASIVLADEGFRAVSLGADLPFESLRLAIEHHAPKVVWSSVSHVEDRGRLEDEFGALVRWLEPQSRYLVVGGCASGELTLPTGRGVFRAHCLGDLATFARALTDRGDAGEVAIPR
ncbi:MAG: helix-turn-helix domain-containing protein [Planctomycetes bacterium]|nr:helix-turn-helix domain-containing protein [Planctomycetota bacterium]